MLLTDSRAPEHRNDFLGSVKSLLDLSVELHSYSEFLAKICRPVGTFSMPCLLTREHSA